MEQDADLKKVIEKFALQNSVKFEGRANVGAVIGKVLAEKPGLKNNTKELAKQISKIIKEISKLSVDEQRAKLEQIAPELLEKKEHIHTLKELDGVDKSKGVIMRFAPSPSGPMHIGHAITGGLTSLYVKRYGGKFILRIEDTNSDNIYTPAYEMLPADAEWIFGNVTDVWIQSDRMGVYYSYVEKLLDLHSVYVCTCTQEKFKQHSTNKEDCPCRSFSVEENKLSWKKMFDKKLGFQEGEAVLRFKSGMHHPNPAMRDFPLVRINDSEHPRQGFKYRVWPLMNLCVTVDDIEAGMTHIIRAKEHADNAKRQELMYNALGLGKRFSKTYFLGRYNFEGLEVSCSKTKARINAGEFSGWDDIRLPFLAALKRRGYRSGAFLKYTELTGLSAVDKTVGADEFFKSINAFNKQIIDPKSKRFFFIAAPVEIDVHGAPSRDFELDLHPENIKGGRKFSVHSMFFIQKSDFERFAENDFIRLMDCLNFKFSRGKAEFVSLKYEDFKAKGNKIIHWLPADKTVVRAEVLMPDNTLVKGLCESNVKSLNVDDVVQLERFGFCRLDRIENGKYVFWYAHK